MFAGILSYHAYLQLNKTRCFTSIKRELAKINLTRLYRKIPDDDDYYPPPPSPPPQKVGVQKLPTTTTVVTLQKVSKSPDFFDFIYKVECYYSTDGVSSRDFDVGRGYDYVPKI